MQQKFQNKLSKRLYSYEVSSLYKYSTIPIPIPIYVCNGIFTYDYIKIICINCTRLRAILISPP